MTGDGVGDEGELPAGKFGAWLSEVQAAIRGEGDSDVPCDGCTACCTSSQFVHIAPDETGTLARIPPDLLFPAPGFPRGHVLLGYDERGHCPMLVDNRCSIYEDRPRTCRTYDCRVFPASGVDPGRDGETKALVARRAARWRFEHPTPDDVVRHESVRAAAAFLDRHRESFAGLAPTSATPLAVLAVEIHDLFVGRADPEPDAVRAELSHIRARPAQDF